MRRKQYKSWLSVWFPFGLWRIDWYFIRFYVRAFVLIILAMAALVAIGDMFQRFDDFVLLSRRENHDLAEGVMLFLRYYGSWVPQLVFQYMLPASMLLAASITATSSYAGPRGNNEYIVIRSAGIPVLRAFLPLLLPALLVAVAFQASRDAYLPDMVRESNAIFNRLKSRVSSPTSITHSGAHGVQTAAIGYLAPRGVAFNLILEIRDAEAFRRGNPALGDNDFVAYRAAKAVLEKAPGGGYQWRPLEKGKKHTYSLFSRHAEDWTDPIPTDITPAMIERQPLGDAVSSWEDLSLMQRDNPGARFEMNWRLAEPLACCLLIIWGTGMCMGRMLRGGSTSFIQSITISMIAAALFYSCRLAGKTLWEAGLLTPVEGVWYPLAAAGFLALIIALWMER